MNVRKLCVDVFVTIVWLLLIIVTVIVIANTEKSYNKVLAIIGLVVLAVIGVAVILLNIIAVIINLLLSYCISDTQTNMKNIGIKFEKEFLTLEYDNWEEKRDYWLDQFFDESFPFFFVDELFVKEDIARIGNYLLLWKNVALIISEIVSIMSESSTADLSHHNYHRIKCFLIPRARSSVQEINELSRKFEYISVETLAKKYEREVRNLSKRFNSISSNSGTHFADNQNKREIVIDINNSIPGIQIENRECNINIDFHSI